MLNKSEIEICKQELVNYIKFMESTGDNAGWARGLKWYIGQLETKVKELGKGQHSLMQSRKRWKNRYYKQRSKVKELKQEKQKVIEFMRDTLDYIDENLEEMKVDNMYARYKRYGSKLRFEKIFAYNDGAKEKLKEILKLYNEGEKEKC